MKQAFAILFAIALVIGQPLTAIAASCDSKPSPCCDCGGKMKCCLADSDQSPQEIPAAPTPSNLTSPDFQTVLWLTVSFTAPVAAIDSRVAAKDFSASAFSTLPLFTRDCAFLI